MKKFYTLQMTRTVMFTCILLVAVNMHVDAETSLGITLKKLHKNGLDLLGGNKHKPSFLELKIALGLFGGFAY